LSRDAIHRLVRPKSGCRQPVDGDYCSWRTGYFEMRGTRLLWIFHAGLTSFRSGFSTKPYQFFLGVVALILHIIPASRDGHLFDDAVSAIF
jgi:hypothetical protein